MADNHSAKGHEAHGHHHSGAPYVILWIVLLALTGISYWVSLPEVGLTGVTGMIVAMAIASTKATLVMWIFMHLNENKNFLIRGVMPMALLFMAIMIFIMLSDTLTRTTFPTHGEPEHAFLPVEEHAPAHGAEGAHGAPAPAPAH